jgi:two-component system phosphate regulon response regulator PhoB
MDARFARTDRLRTEFSTNLNETLTKRFYVGRKIQGKNGFPERVSRVKERILVVEDEKDLQELVRYTLERKGYEAITVASSEQALPILRSQIIHLLILDLMLPGMDGFQFCKLIKSDKSLKHIPVMMVTALSEDSDIVAGLELGAEDYITKPFSPAVLSARVRALLRRGLDTPKQDETPIAIGNLEIFPGHHQVRAKGRDVHLSLTEFRILYTLAKNPGWVFTRYQILDEVRGEGYVATDRVVDVHITSLRKKLGSIGDQVETVRGVGYRFRGGEQTAQ